MLVHAWLAFVAMILPALALAQEAVLPGYTHTVEKFISVPAWTTTVTVTGVCMHPASSTAAAPPGFSCLPGGPLYKVVKGSSTTWPCGTPGPSDSITVVPGVSTFTVVPENTTEVWVTATDSITVPEPDPTTTSTIWITGAEEPTTVLTSTSSTTVAFGTSTIFDDSPAVTASPYATTFFTTPLSSLTSKPSLSCTLHTPHGWTHGWNHSTTSTRPESFGNITGVTDGVTVLKSHTPLTTRTFNFTIARSTALADVSVVTAKPTIMATKLPSIVSTLHGNSSRTTYATPCPEPGNWGNFTIDFDEPYGVKRSRNASHPFVRVQSPNHFLLFNSGYVYAPVDDDQIEPASPPHMAMYVPSMTNRQMRVEGSRRKGGIGRLNDPVLHFNAYGGFFSCLKGLMSPTNGSDPLNCTLEVSGFRWDSDAQQEKLQAISTFDMVPCLETNVNARGKCEMTEIDFSKAGANFTDLSSISLKSYFWTDVEDEQMFFLDDLKLGWTDNSCKAGTTRGRGG